jgi:bisphosphoglycerate-independent phosphoglycerate mutase (AlkP superfamily)
LIFVFVTGEIVKMSDRPKPVVSLILEGRGHSPERECNAIAKQTEYREVLDYPAVRLPIHIENGLDKVLSNPGMKQFGPRKTENYAHVSYLLNGSKIRLIAGHGNTRPVRNEEAGQPGAGHGRTQAPPMSICGNEPRTTGRPSRPAPTTPDVLGIPRLVEVAGRSLPAAH